MASKGIADQIAIIGMGCTKFGENWEKSSDDMIVEAAFEAFEDAGIEPGQIEAGWVGTTGSGATGMALARPLQLQYIPVTRVENACSTATDAFRNACFGVASGMYDVALVVGFEKLKDGGQRGLGSAGGHPVVNVGSTAPGSFALAATRYFHKYGIGKETLAKISVKNHHNGALSPKAHFQREVTIEQVMKAPIIAWPLGLFDCCPTCDGAAAAVITRKELAKNYNKDYISVKALGLAVGFGKGVLHKDYDFVHFPETLRASQQAYEQAGITDPLKEIDLASVHDCFSITELLIYEDMGFCPKGQAKDYIDDGTFTLEGELPVNTDGGLKSFGHPIGASGLRMMYEVYKQLQGKADKRQLKDPKIGATHNLGGSPGGGFACAVTILTKD